MLLIRLNDDESFGVETGDAKMRSKNRRRGDSEILDDGVGVGFSSAKTFVFRGTNAKMYCSGGLLKPKTTRCPISTRSVSAYDQKRAVSLSHGGV